MSNLPKPIQSVIAPFRKHYLLWVVPTASFAILSLVYAFFGPSRWQASQTFLIRDELIGRSYETPGRFESMEMLKSTQEIISEVAHKPNVIRDMLRKANIDNKAQNADWPSDKMIEETQGQISVIAPGGAEFGKSELLEIRITGNSRENARVLISSLAEEIDKHLRIIRKDRANSMAAELTEAVSMAKTNLDKVSSELKEIESELGSDLLELRNLNSTSSLSSSLQNTLESVRTETRAAIADDELLHKHLVLLTAAKDDLNQLRSTPEEIFLLLPVLNDLKEGMVKAQLELSQKLGKYNENHPLVAASKIEIQRIQNDIRKELTTTIKSKSKERTIAQQKIARLNGEEQRLSARLSAISNRRVEYEKLTALVDQRHLTLTNTRNELDRMNSIARAAEKVDLLTRVDKPNVGTRPIGLAKRYLVTSSTGLGFLLGVGLVMMLSSPTLTTQSELEDERRHTSPPNSKGPSDNSSVDRVSKRFTVAEDLQSKQNPSPKNITVSLDTQPLDSSTEIVVPTTSTVHNTSTVDNKVEPSTDEPATGEPAMGKSIDSLIELNPRDSKTKQPEPSGPLANSPSKPTSKPPSKPSNKTIPTKNENDQVQTQSISAPVAKKLVIQPTSEKKNKTNTTSGPHHKTNEPQETPQLRRPTASELFMIASATPSPESELHESELHESESSKLSKTKPDESKKTVMTDSKQSEPVSNDERQGESKPTQSFSEIRFKKKKDKTHPAKTEVAKSKPPIDSTPNRRMDPFAQSTRDFTNMDTIVVFDEKEMSIIVDDQKSSGNEKNIPVGKSATECIIIDDDITNLNPAQPTSNPTNKDNKQEKKTDGIKVPIAQTLVLNNSELPNQRRSTSKNHPSAPKTQNVKHQGLPKANAQSLPSKQAKKKGKLPAGGSIFIFPAPKKEKKKS